MPRKGSPYGGSHESDRARLLRGGRRCSICGGPGANSAHHVPALSRHRHRPGSGCCRLLPAHLACNVADGRRLGAETMRRRFAAVRARR